MASETPVCWNSLCFEHTRHDDTTDHYRTECGNGRLAHQRSTGVWLAELRGAIATARRGDDEAAWKTDANDVARRALEGALKQLRKRVKADQQWLVMIDREIG